MLRLDPRCPKQLKTAPVTTLTTDKTRNIVDLPSYEFKS